MDAPAIKAALDQLGLTQRAVAKEVGCSPGHVSDVIHRKTRSRRVARLIAQALGRERWEVFPDYYTPPEGVSGPVAAETLVTDLERARRQLSAFQQDRRNAPALITALDALKRRLEVDLVGLKAWHRANFAQIENGRHHNGG